MAADLLEMSVTLVTAHLSKNQMSAAEVPDFLRKVHETLKDLQGDRQLADGSSSLATSASIAAMRLHACDAAAASQAGQDGVAVREDGASSKVAHKLGNDLSEPEFEGLDPWLCERISPGIARRLNRAESIHPSVYPDKIICLEDGKEVKLLRSYVEKHFKLNEEEYRCKWRLPDDYPMAPPVYIENKRKLAAAAGLGRAVRANKEKSNRSKIADAGKVPGGKA